MQKNWYVKNLNNKYFLRIGKKIFVCQIGANGLKNPLKKVEGDKTTPTGKWYLKALYYRPDRVLRPKFKKKNIFKIKKISKNCGWCDDIKSNYYNKYIKINDYRSLKINYENLWREDNAYDIIIVISHNMKPVKKNKGSAIFLHCSFSDKRDTSGCIALKKRDLILAINNMKNNICLRI